MYLDSKDGKLEISSADDTWKEWTEFHASKEIKDLIDIGNKKLRQATDMKAKDMGKGKGKSKEA